MSETSFYVTGGTLPPDSASYIERTADTELLTALQNGELCYVLNARQMGKSSLSVRTRQALEATGTRTAFLDLQKFGSSATAEQWYRAILERIGNDLKLRPQFLAYWRDNAELPPLTRVFNALRDVALAQLPGKLVVFLDEIDVVRDLDFKTDEFFGAIRETHNARAEDPELKRLTFCILGTVAPTDLIRDIRLSPFNIGVRIKLADFTPAEAAPLAAPLPGKEKTLERVLWWTSGHPYLTQRLCAELTKTSSADVDFAVARLFFSKSDADVDENIKNVRNGVLRMGGEGAGFDRVDLLTRYGKLASGKRVADDDTDGVCTALRLSGLVTSTDGVLRVRNRVYAKLFDAAWVKDNLPDAELRRQKAAVAKARWQIGSITAAVMIAMTGLTLVATQSARQAQASAKESLRAKREADAERTKAQEERTKALSAAQSESQAKKLAQAAALKAQTATTKAEAALKGESAAKAAALASVTTAREQAQRADREASVARVQTGIAQTNADVASKFAYISNCNLAQAAIENNNYGLAQQYIDDMAHLLKKNQWMKPGYEWVYLNEQIRLEKKHYSYKKPVNVSIYSHTGKYILISTGEKLQIIDSNIGNEIFSFSIKNNTINAASFSPNDEFIAVGGSNKKAYVINIKSRKIVTTFSKHQSPILSIAFSPQGDKVVTGCGGDWYMKDEESSARIWEASSGKEIAIIKNSRMPYDAVLFSPDGKQILTHSERVVLSNAENGTYISEFNEYISSKEIFFTNDGTKIITANGIHTNADISIHSFDLKTRHLISTINIRQPFTKLEYNTDGSKLAYAGIDNNVYIYDTLENKEILALKGHTDKIRYISFSPDGKNIITGSDDNTARVWDVTINREQLTFNNKGHFISSVLFSSNGKNIKIICDDGYTEYLDVTTGKKLPKITNPISYTPNRAKIKIVKILNNATPLFENNKYATLIRTAVKMNSIFKNKFSKIIINIVNPSQLNNPSIIYLHNYENSHTQKLIGHTDQVTSISVSPNRRYPVSVPL